MLEGIESPDGHGMTSWDDRVALDSWTDLRFLRNVHLYDWGGFLFLKESNHKVIVLDVHEILGGPSVHGVHLCDLSGFLS